jgi:mono/diheme cytochrome c family protein
MTKRGLLALVIVLLIAGLVAFGVYKYKQIDVLPTPEPVSLPIPLSALPSIALSLVGDQIAGARVYTANCENCHGVGGKNEGSTVGPGLARIGIKPGQVAYMIENPAAVDKDSGMPKLPLTQQELADVSQYVASLK